MAKKTERTSKPAKTQKGDRWTVRGVSGKLQKSAGDAARARGLTLGQWLSEVLTAALANQRSRAPAEAAGGWEQAVERRLADLEAAVFQRNPAGPEAVADAVARPS